MLVIKVNPKQEDSFVCLMQQMNEKKFRYFMDVEKQQIINFDDTVNVQFFRTVRSKCDIIAVMCENFKNYPFVDDQLNNLFTLSVEQLIMLEAENYKTARQILENLSSMIMDSITSNKTASPTETAVDKVAKTTTVESKKSPNILDIIPEDVKHSMSAKELTLLPYVYKGLAEANKRKNADKLKKIEVFLSTIGYPDDAYIIKMFSSLEEISSITYENIFASKAFSGKRIYSNKELRDKVRNDFRAWANKNCASELEKNHLLSFADILKIYKRFVE